VTSAPIITARTLGATALALVLVGIAGWLGWWQLGAWQSRRDAEARDLTSLSPVGLDDVMGSDDPFPGDEVGRPVDVAGSWLGDGSFLVSGRTQDGRDGYWAVTPLALDESGGDTAVLVVRGWTPEADAPPPAGPASITGWLQPPEGTGAVDDDPDDDVVPQLRIADAVQRVDADLYGAYLVAQEPGPGLEAASLESLPEVGRFTALRNLLYAAEWWFFGAFAAFIWWRWLRDERAVDRVTDSAS
jgi:cytochrome oxidase assembly protein ShyY1